MCHPVIASQGIPGYALASKIAAPCGASVVTAECCIEDDFVIGKFAVDVAGALKIGLWQTPQKRIRCTRCDIGRD